jgi:ABC-type multidrug transport system ATPase subunit
VLNSGWIIMTKTCSHCASANAEANKFCQQCGKPLDADPTPAPPSDETVRWSGQPVQAKGPHRRAVPVDVLFGSKSKLIIGRAPECDVCLSHPTVSRYHALLERLPEGLRLSDLHSVNGVLVGGQRITEPVLIQERERVGVGPYLFSLAGGIIHSLDSSQSLRLEARNLEKVVGAANGQRRKLLDNINLAVEPGEFISLLGPSGSGKSTLMDCLNGRRPATGGRVLANGEDFYRHYDSFRMSLGYVPQRDIVHTQLTVHRALYYTARLRLPTDTTPRELNTRIEEVIQVMELGPHRQTLVADLSGGQIKRVSLGAELLARPCLLYIDEATSGLDAGTEARMMRLFRQLADEGKSVICITHNVENVDRCNLILVLARGKLVFFGPPQEAPPYFGVSRLSEIYDRIAEKEPDAWEREFVACSLHKEFVQQRITVETAEAKAEDDKGGREAPLAALRALVPELPGLRKPVELSADRPYRPPLWHQFQVLTGRYAELIWGDRRSLRLLFLQAPVVALVILLGFMNKGYDDVLPVPRELDPAEHKALEVVNSLLRAGPIHRDLTPKERETLEGIRFALNEGGSVNAYELLRGVQKFDESQVLDKLLAAKGPAVPGQAIVNPRYTYMLLFMLAVTVLWFGCNNAAKEIVKEEAIYGRERAVNLGILPYLGSKFLILTIVSAFQTLLLMGIIYGGLMLMHLVRGDAMPHAGYQLAYLPQYGVLVLLAMTGVALGLLLSACVSTPDRANSLLPYVLIPQIILGGGIMTINEGPLHWLAMAASPVYWAYRAIHLGAGSLPAYIPGSVDYDENLPLACTALGVQMVVLLLLTAWFLRQKDVRKA